MIKVAFFDAKPYDKEYFDKYNRNVDITYYEEKLSPHTAKMSQGFDAVCVFVNDNVNKDVIDILYENGVSLIAMRCAGYSNADVEYACGKINIVRVPAYSPYAVAEFAVSLLLTLNRKLYRAYNRTRDFNFSINGLLGTDLHGKTAGIIGTGKIGKITANILKGFGMNILAYDLYPDEKSGLEYVSLEELLTKSDVISLHCPLTKETKYIINEEALMLIKDDAFIINTSRGGLIDTKALIKALNSGKLAGVGLDVYEEEAELFFEDRSGTVIKDDVLSLLVSRPNVLLTSHQAFFTKEALSAIAKTTLDNIESFFNSHALNNEVCYNCKTGKIHDNCFRKREDSVCK